ncbi:MAG TPA: NUDIX domain-containing protein [Chloroflexota bacterium]|nr:NUDIX domain-containing protein [Chloroflexota bacterium]
MKETHVVTCLLLNAEGRLLILRRSNRVGSYQARWAGVSGYMEADPEEQAYRELQEEVGLTPHDVKLLRKGEPMDVPDPELGKVWVVHPFLFLVADAERVRLDWEHTESRWIEPNDLPTYSTVPGLVQLLERIYPTSSRP